MGDRTQFTLAQASLERQEISNYARSEHESRHNVNYWEGGDCLGIDVGAHSHRIPDDPLGECWQNGLSPDRVHASDLRSRPRGDRARARGVASGLGGMPVYGTVDDRRGFRVGVWAAIRDGARGRRCTDRSVTSEERRT